MATILSARDLSKSYPGNVLFEGVNLHVEDGDRLGLIGPNGAGKSTLLKILAGLEEPDAGEVHRRRSLRAAFIAQDDRFPEGATPHGAAVAAAEGVADTLQVDPDTQAAIVLSQLGFDDVEQPVATLSGGWRKRLSLACGLVLDPDVLMLDEPTNHLDLEGVLWLEDFVRRSARTMTMMFVTHDRRFLENTASRIVELSKAYPGGVFETDGNYSEFVRRKEAFLDAQEAAESALANNVRRDNAWLKQGIKARETRNTSQVKAADARRAELAATRDRNLAPTRATTIDFQSTDRRSRKLIALDGVAKSMGGRELFRDLELVLSPGERLGLLGLNGAGKTTLLRLLAGELEPDAGTIQRADRLRVVTFSQDRASLDPRKTLHQALCPIGDFVDFGGKQVHVAGWAKRFLFSQDQLPTFVQHLSGGEQARVVIANLMLEPADVLLLDEPTNDLDIPSLEVLEQSLLQFTGALVLVTHDRFMLERLATEFIGLDGHGGARRFQTFERWMDARAQTERGAEDAAAARRASAGSPASGSRTAGSAAAPASAPPAATKAPARKLSYKEQREFDAMETAIVEAEAEVERLEVEAAHPELTTDHARAAAAYEALTEAQARVAALYARWSELEAMQTG